jgi:ubiquinone/menaquinone biosynthesis C-methylase UbiE
MALSDNVWNYIAPLYRTLRSNPIAGYFLKTEMQAAHSLLQQLDFSVIQSICDLGVGRGHSLDLINSEPASIIALDKSLSMARYTKKHYSETQFMVGDALYLPFKESSMDLIICIGLAEYIHELGLLLRQIRTALISQRFLLFSYSPKSILNSLRVLRGHKLYTRNFTEIQTHLRNCHFKILDNKMTPMQQQYLLQKE